MEYQLTFRLPADLERALSREARARGVTRAELVREAVAAYLATGGPAATADVAAARLAPFLGAVRLDRAAVERDALTRRIREQNWRR